MDRKEFHGKRPLCFSTITVSECQILLLFLWIWRTYKKVFRSTVAEFSTWCKLCVLYFESKIVGPGCKSAFVPKSKIGRFIKLSTYFWIHKFLSCFFFFALSPWKAVKIYRVLSMNRSQSLWLPWFSAKHNTCANICNTVYLLSIIPSNLLCYGSSE